MKNKTGIIIAAIIVVCGGVFGGWMYHSAQVDKMRDAGVQALHADINLEDYRDKQQEEINAIFKESEEKIMESGDQEAIDKINADARDEIAKIKTDAQLNVEEGVEKLEASVSLKDYREEQKAEVEKILKEAKKDIQEAGDKKEIKKILKDAQADIDEIKTDEQLTAEEQAAAQAAAAAAARKSSGKRSSGSSNSGGCVGNDASNFY